MFYLSEQMKNLSLCRQQPIDNRQFQLYKAFHGYAHQVAYLLNLQAQKHFKEKLGITPDICIVTDCLVDTDQQTIYPTQTTRYKLF